ncbi:hypothetical protein [Bacteroides caccae]|uniref:hypothetical protein n=1 Tax=Bacteroides caccae TaxID=47678 RepID=UPI00129CE1C3
MEKRPRMKRTGTGNSSGENGLDDGNKHQLSKQHVRVPFERKKPPASENPQDGLMKCC